MAPTSGEYFESTNPATRAVLYQAARGNAADVAAAVDAAAQPSRTHAGATSARRAVVTCCAGSATSSASNARNSPAPESQDNGCCANARQLKTLPEYYYYYAGLADKIHGDVIPTSDRKVLNYTRASRSAWSGRSPVELAADLTTSKPAPALCVGNTVVIKPSEYTPPSSGSPSWPSRPASRPGRSTS